MNIDQFTKQPLPEIRSAYTRRDTILYALGVAACQNPLDPEDLKFVYESTLQALPSLACVIAQPSFLTRAPEQEVDWARAVHAEQYFNLCAPLPAEGDVVARYRITGIVDKGPQSGALVYFEKSLYSTGGSQLGTVESTVFLRGDGGCGNWGRPGREFPVVPTGAPLGAMEVATLPISALIYRLSGDYNPLHADPEIARQAGFDKPILHGLCTFGIACHALIRALCHSNATRLLSLGARFTKPVFPGETIRTEFWHSGGERVQFRCISSQRNEVVLDRGVARVLAER
jgi:acyl dehydratase